MKNVSLPESWDEETEVIVIGSGFAGLAAAMEAKTQAVLSSSWKK